jgi:hypothetical protein
MRAINLFWLALIAAFIVAGRVPAQAQSQPTPQQLQSMIASGQAKTALSDLHQVLESHPDSGVAWYLVAEAEDSLGDESQARQALAKAEQFSPGLPFARQDNVAALQAHLAQPAAQIGFHISPGLVIGALVILFLGLRFLSHRRAVPFGYQGGYAAGFPGRPYGPMPYGPGSAGYGPGMGGGLGSSLIGGLAAGAGFAAGERIIDGMISPGENQGFGGQSNDPGQVPDRDDGLSGSPGWDDGGNNGGGFDSGGGW